MFSKSLFTALSLIALCATSALAVPALSCPAQSTVTVTASSAKLAATSVAANGGKAAGATTSTAKVTTSKVTSSVKATSTKVTSSAKATSTKVSSSAKATSSSKATSTVATSRAAVATSVTGAFGSCSTPEISFAAGLDGRKETAFVPTDLSSFNHGSADNIDVISSFICQQLKDKCKAGQAALTTCANAEKAADAAAAGTGAQADAFNAAFGVTTNFASVAVINNQGQTVSTGTTGSKSTGSNTGSGANSNTGTTTTAATSTTTTATSSSGGNAAADDQQSATTLNSAVIATGFAEDGQQVPAAGQVASLTSTNNFINFCLTVNKPITNGQQITTGSCNPAPMGVIAATTNMPSSKFTNPKNLDTIKANTPFTITMAINNLETGNFVNAQTNYYSAPQQVNSDGDIIGHSHVVIEQISSLDQTTTTDPSKFAFFKGINGKAVNGVISADVTDGLPAGVYRMASINAAANHQPVLVAVAQHGSLDDMVYFTVQ